MNWDEKVKSCAKTIYRSIIMATTERFKGKLMLHISLIGSAYSLYVVSISVGLIKCKYLLNLSKPNEKDSDHIKGRKMMYIEW